jgi:hypothetical protein
MAIKNGIAIPIAAKTMWNPRETAICIRAASKLPMMFLLVSLLSRFFYLLQLLADIEGFLHSVSI